MKDYEKLTKWIIERREGIGKGLMVLVNAPQNVIPGIAEEGKGDETKIKEKRAALLKVLEELINPKEPQQEAKIKKGLAEAMEGSYSQEKKEKLLASVKELIQVEKVRDQEKEVLTEIYENLKTMDPEFKENAGIWWNAQRNQEHLRVVDWVWAKKEGVGKELMILVKAPQEVIPNIVRETEIHALIDRSRYSKEKRDNLLRTIEKIMNAEACSGEDKEMLELIHERLKTKDLRFAEALGTWWTSQRLVEHKRLVAWIQERKEGLGKDLMILVENPREVVKSHDEKYYYRSGLDKIPFDPGKLLELIKSLEKTIAEKNISDDERLVLKGLKEDLEGQGKEFSKVIGKWWADQKKKKSNKKNIAGIEKIKTGGVKRDRRLKGTRVAPKKVIFNYILTSNLSFEGAIKEVEGIFGCEIKTNEIADGVIIIEIFSRGTGKKMGGFVRDHGAYIYEDKRAVKHRIFK